MQHQIFTPGSLCLKCYDDWLVGKIDKWYKYAQVGSSYLPEEVLVLIRLSGSTVIITVDPETGYESHTYGQNFGPKVRCVNCGGRGAWPLLDDDSIGRSDLEQLLAQLESKFWIASKVPFRV